MAALADDLALRGHKITLVTLSDDGPQRRSTSPSVKRMCLNVKSNARGPLAKWRQVLKRQKGIATAIDSITPDAVLSFCDRMNIDVLMAKPLHRPPIVVCERSDPAAQSLGSVWGWLRSRTYRRAIRVVALTDAAKAFLAAFSQNVVVIPSAVKQPESSSCRDEAQANRRIVGAGRLEIEKGFDRLVDAFAIATAQHPEWSLHIYGEGSQRETLQRQIESLGLSARVELPGWVQPLGPALAQATMFCLSSRYEGFPSVLLEAMAMAIPTISVDCESGPRAIIQDKHDGLLIENDVTSLANAIKQLIENPDQREQLGRRGPDVLDRFGWQTMVDRYEQLLLDVVR